MKYVALLRGINVGGRNMLPMKSLAALFEENGRNSVMTYIQSGNVVFNATAAAARTLPSRISAAIGERFGYKIPVILRTASQLSSVIHDNPHFRNGLPAKELHICFLADTPASERVQALDPLRSAPDTFVVSGAEIYLHLPHGAGNSRLTNVWFDTNLATTSTLRNWATVLRLNEIMKSE
ncbi:MAG TPA: DUF1697 domain-containing protein [Bryobacteraceae bacterium]|jgi:uncharacterized protein (DUF1697 family)|nr:DUF1697 domain-containing protein [Bryobacteraceae bacterium]